MKHIIKVLGLSFFLLFSSGSYAQGSHEMPLKHYGPAFHLLEKVSLSDEQKAQIKAIRDSEKAQVEALAMDRNEQFKAIKNLVKQPDFDEVAVRELLTNYQAQELELKVIRLRAKNSLFNVLTTEQQEVLNELKMDLKRKHRRHRGRN